MKFLDFKCRGRQKKNPQFECGQRIGGPAIDTVNSHDFSKGPFVDMRRCSKCGWVKITIPDINKPPLMEILGHDVTIDFQKPEKRYGVMEVLRPCR